MDKNELRRRGDKSMAMATQTEPRHIGRPKGSYKLSPQEYEAYAESLEAWMEDDEHWWLKGWALHHHIPVEYISRWAQQNERFRQAYARASALQEERLLKIGMFNRTAGRIVELVLKTKHGFTDRLQSTNESTQMSIPNDPRGIQAQIERLREALDAQEQIREMAERVGSAVINE